MFETDDYDQILSQFEFPEEATSKVTEHVSKAAKIPILNGNDENKISSSQCNIEIFSSELKTTVTNKKTIARNSELNKHDEILSQCEIPAKEQCDQKCVISQSIVNENESNGTLCPDEIIKNVRTNIVTNKKATEEEITGYVSPKHMKRKMINAYFDHKTKRKFPGPAGILTDCTENNKDESFCQMELLSQDVDFTQNHLGSDLFECPLWARLQNDLNDWNFKDIDSIKTIKQKTITSNLRRKKAHTVTAFIEAVDRSVIDPMVILKDTTGTIKGTLHRDAWSAFSHYIASEYCAFILWKPTILITGAAFKKYYLNITLNNILAVYSSTVLNEEMEKKSLPDGYSVVYEDNYTVIKSLNCVQKADEMNALNSIFDNELPEDLESMFSDDAF